MAFQYIGSLEDYAIKPNDRGGFNLWRFKDWSQGGWVVVCRGTREALGLELLKRFGLEPEPDEKPTVVMAQIVMIQDRLTGYSSSRSHPVADAKTRRPIGPAICTGANGEPRSISPWSGWRASVGVTAGKDRQPT